MADPETAPRVYSNLVRMHGGPYDVLVDFQRQLLEPTEDGQVNGETVVQVSMSWSHLKSMIPLMVKLVAEYEKNVGAAIPAPGFDDFSKE